MTKPTPIKIDEFVELLKDPLSIMVMGLAARHHNIHPSIMLPALAIAMGAVMSEASVANDIAETLRLRKAIEDAFTNILKKHASPLKTADLSNIKAS